jgi:hypothetical protein
LQALVHDVMPHLRRLLATALILLMQGPAMLVQEVAWVKMLVSYTQERGLKRGVIETFDGNHPCALCHKAEKLRQQEKPSDPDGKQLPESQRVRLAWAEMIAGERIHLANPPGRDVVHGAPVCASRDSGIGADAPVPPPPKLG